MTNTEIIATIRNEIERLIELNKTKNGFPASWPCEFRIEAYEVLLSVLDTIESEKPVPNDLEEAAMNYIAPIEKEEDK